MWRASTPGKATGLDNTQSQRVMQARSDFIPSQKNSGGTPGAVYTSSYTSKIADNIFSFYILSLGKNCVNISLYFSILNNP